jgi:hypothetical protein
VKYLYDTGVILRHRFAASWPGFRRGRERKTHSARGVVQTFAQFVALVPQCLPLVCLQSSLSVQTFVEARAGRGLKVPRALAFWSLVANSCRERAERRWMLLDFLLFSSIDSRRRVLEEV